MLALCTLLTQVASYKNIILVGDININIRETSDIAINYLDTVAFHGMLPAYDHPTGNNNCLYHVILKTMLTNSTYILQTAIMDHQAVLCCLKYKNTSQSNRLKTTKKVNMDNILKEALQFDYNSIYNIDDLDSVTNLFIDYTQQIILKNTHS